ncbi:MAG: hypothetical protein GW794_01195 [Flavobacteriales bacterium]|nr:hypothetical protein [Flavobacteriales bacterium]
MCHFLKISLSVTLMFLMFESVNAQIKKTASVEGINEYMLDNGLKVDLAMKDMAKKGWLIY